MYITKNVMAEAIPITLVLTMNGELSIFIKNANIIGNATVSRTMLIV